MEGKKYTIGRLIYYQRELTFKQQKRLIDFGTKAGARLNGRDEITFKAKQLHSLLVKKDIIGLFWGLVLHPQRDFRYYLSRFTLLMFNLIYLISFRWHRLKPLFHVDVDPLTYSDQEAMMQDFFFFNKKLIGKLSGLNESLGLIARTALSLTERNGGLKNTTMKTSSQKTNSKSPQSARGS